MFSAAPVAQRKRAHGDNAIALYSGSQSAREVVKFDVEGVVVGDPIAKRFRGRDALDLVDANRAAKAPAEPSCELGTELVEMLLEAHYICRFEPRLGACEILAVALTRQLNRFLRDRSGPLKPVRSQPRNSRQTW
jgi:hypothetical protein